MTIQEIQNRLQQLSFDPKVLERYNEHHRYYHTIDHIHYLLDFFEKKNLLNDHELFLTAIFHDAVYDPKSSANEEDSAVLFKTEAANPIAIGLLIIA